jgi:hypothetical protein
MYPLELNQSSIQPNLEFQLLTFNWALQLLSALEFIHAYKVLYGILHTRSC